MYRKATGQDIDVILKLFKAGLDEIGIKDYKESFLVNKICCSFHLAPCFLLENHGKIVGMAALGAGTCTFTGKATLNEYMFYIEPEYRNLSNLGGLVRECKKFALEHQLPLRLSFVVNKDEKVRARMLRMYGFEPVEIAGIYNG